MLYSSIVRHGKYNVTSCFVIQIKFHSVYNFMDFVVFIGTFLEVKGELLLLMTVILMIVLLLLFVVVTVIILILVVLV
jgi:hypothetical protein